MKNMLIRINRKLGKAEENTNNLENIVIEPTQNETQRNMITVKNMNRAAVKSLGHIKYM